MTLTTKIISATVGGTVIAGGAGSAIFLSTRGTLISDLLKEDKKVLNEESEWSAAWAKYLGNDDSNKKDKWRIGGNLNKSSVDPKFKTECQNRQKHRVSGKEDQNYKDFLEWCAKAQ